jgi:hypothetical protein
LGKRTAAGIAGLAAVAGALIVGISAFGSDTEPDQLEDLFTPICESANGHVDRGSEDLDEDELSVAEDFHGKGFRKVIEGAEPEIVRISCEVGGSSLRHYEFDRPHDVKRAAAAHRGGRTCLLSKSSFFDGPGNKLPDFCAELDGEVMPTAGPSPWSLR